MKSKKLLRRKYEKTLQKIKDQMKANRMSEQIVEIAKEKLEQDRQRRQKGI